MSALELPIQENTSDELPRVYLACPLTGLTAAAQRQIEADVAIIKQAVERETKLDRLAGDSWPVTVYAPINHTPPWKEDGLPPAAVYRQNLGAVHDSDALIVVAEKGGSAGVGQELEWATRLGLPIAYLTAGTHVSRQIAGAPAFISPQSYNKNPEVLEDHVKNFLRRWKPMILDGPRRRASRLVRFEPITLRLRGAWQSCANPTEVAAQVRVDINYLELALSDPRYVAVMPMDTLLALGHQLGVSLRSLEPGPSFALPVPALRALMAAAGEDGWSDDVVQRLIYEGRSSIECGDGTDLTTISSWRTLRGRLDK